MCWRLMRLIDSHVHLYPPEIGNDPAGWAATQGEPHWSLLCTRRRKDGSPVQTFPRVDELLREMDGAGIARAILLGWYWEQPENCARQNRFYAGCVRAHPDRLSACAALHPAAPDALAQIRRAKDAGFCGLGELSPHSQHVTADDPAWLAVLALAGELQLPVNLHVTDPDSKPYPGRVATPPPDFIRWAREFPATTFVLAHWGGGLALASGAPLPANLFFDTAASSLLYPSACWSQGVVAVGGGRILFGSDHPLRLYPHRLAGSGLAELVAEARESLPLPGRAGVFAANARTVYHLPAD